MNGKKKEKMHEEQKNGKIDYLVDKYQICCADNEGTSSWRKSKIFLWIVLKMLFIMCKANENKK